MDYDQVPARAEYNKGEMINGEYKVLRSLGNGAFGHVYEVTGPDKVHYALKLLRLWEVPSDIRQSLTERFVMEFKTAQIDSPFLVRSLDYGRAEGNPFILMEFCSGGDLTTLIGNKRANFSKIACEILMGLHALHSNGKVHRDLKPENVLFKNDGTAALTDFGISGDRNNRMTQKGVLGKPLQIFGTYAYMPPEQVTRSRTATVLPTTDIFSFGVMMFQLITGVLPFGQLDSQNDLVIYQKKGKSGEWNREELLNTPDGYLWEKLIEGCLNPDYKNRIQSAKDALNLVPQAANRDTTQRDHFIAQAEQIKEGENGARLVIMHGDDYGHTYDLTQLSQEKGKLQISLGRSAYNDLVVNDPYLSRTHCILEGHSERKQWRIRDGQWSKESGKWQRSTNGTFINSTEVDENGHTLHNGDIITLGDVKLRYELY